MMANCLGGLGAAHFGILDQLIEFLEMLLQSILVVGNGDTGSTSSSRMGHPGILSIPGSTGSHGMGHPGMIPGIPGY